MNNVKYIFKAKYTSRLCNLFTYRYVNFRDKILGENQVNCYHYLLIQYMILFRLTDRGTSG